MAINQFGISKEESIDLIVSACLKHGEEAELTINVDEVLIFRNVNIAQLF